MSVEPRIDTAGGPIFDCLGCVLARVEWPRLGRTVVTGPPNPAQVIVNGTGVCLDHLSVMDVGSSLSPLYRAALHERAGRGLDQIAPPGTVRRMPREVYEEAGRPVPRDAIEQVQAQGRAKARVETVDEHERRHGPGGVPGCCAYDPDDGT